MPSAPTAVSPELNHFGGSLCAVAAIRNNTALSRFELEADGHIAVANYRLSAGIMTFTHTEVPPALREHGIASRLIHGALAEARAKGFKVVPLCSFVRHYIATHPEFQDLLS